MKFKLIFLILLFSVTSFAQKKIKQKDIACIDNIYYYKDEPLNGTYKIQFSKPNKHFSEIADYVNGVKEGDARMLWRNNLRKEGIYKNNKKEGEWKTYAYHKKNIEEITNYKNGIKEGLEVVYNKYGHSIVDSLFYKNGKLDGIQIRNERYKGRTETLYKNDTIISSILYDTNGQLKESCKYNNYQEENKRCAIYVKKQIGNQLLIYTDSTLSGSDKKILKRYLNDSLQFQVKIIQKEKIYILYYEKNELRMMDEIYSYDNYFVADMIFHSLCYKVKEYAYQSFFAYDDFRCSIYTLILDKPDYYIYRQNSDKNTFSKYRHGYFEGSGDMLPGCVEDKIKDKSELPYKDI